MNGRLIVTGMLCAFAVWLAGADSADAAWEAQTAGSRSSYGFTHTVQWGDTLWGIARRYGTTVGAIMRANGLQTDRIQAGQRIVVPRASWRVPAPQLPGGRMYLVRWGDTLSSIARGHGTTVAAIMRANGLRSYRIYAGQRLFVPMISPRPAPVPTPAPRLPEVFLSPWSGPPGTWVVVRIARFPAWDVVQVGAGPYGSEFSPIASVRTDGSGSAVTHIRANAAAGTNLVIAAKNSGAGWARPTYASALFRVR